MEGDDNCDEAFSGLLGLPVVESEKREICTSCKYALMLRCRTKWLLIFLFKLLDVQLQYAFAVAFQLIHYL